MSIGSHGFCETCNERITVELRKDNQPCPFDIFTCHHPVDMRIESCRCFTWKEATCLCKGCDSDGLVECSVITRHKAEGHGPFK